MKTLRQPWLGTVSIVWIVALAFVLVSQMNYQFFDTWATYALLTTIPVQILLASFWRAQRPACIAALSQPWSGIAFTSICLAVAMVVAPSILWVVGGGSVPPGPLVITFCIHSVTVFLWVAKILRGEPAARYSDSVVVVGGWMLFLCYAVSYLTYRVFFDFSGVLSGLNYANEIAFSGLFHSNVAISFSVTLASVILVYSLLLGFWPLSYLNASSSWRGIALRVLCETMLVVFASLGIYCLFVNLLSMDPIAYMVRVPVSLIFGIFIFQNLLQRTIFHDVRHAGARVILQISFCGFVGVAMHYLYLAAHPLLIAGSAPLEWGEPAHQLELWIASSQLAITFPLIVMFSSFFGFWPFVASTKRTSPASARSIAASSGQVYGKENRNEKNIYPG